MMERPGADSEEKREPVSDIDIAAVDSLKVLDPNRPIREADMLGRPLRAMYGRRPRCKGKIGHFSERGRVQPCIRPLNAAAVAAGPDVIR
jgi:hypothetical protein